MQTGSLYAALKAMSALQPSPLLPQEKILEIGNGIRDFLRKAPVDIISDLEVRS